MDHQRASVNCRKSKGIVAQRQTKAQFNKIWLATAQGRIWRRAGNLCWILAPACLFGASPALCTRGLWKVGWVGFKDLSSEGAHFLSHHCRRKWDPACISSGIVVLKIIWRDRALSASAVLCFKPTLLSFTQVDFYGWLSHFLLLFLNGLMQPAQLCVCLHELWTPLRSILSSSYQPCWQKEKNPKQRAERITLGGW